MVAYNHFTRVDTLELKDLIYRKIGRQRADNYFDHLTKFLCSKLSKADFDKNCTQIIGRGNISLHNRLIRSILQNSRHAKIPPPRKSQKFEAKVPFRNCLPQRKCRYRKFWDRPSPLGPLGKSSSIITCEETVSRNQEFKNWVGVGPVEDGEEVEQLAGSPSFQRWGPIIAPFGVLVKTRKKSIRCGFRYDGVFGETCENNGELPDTRSLRCRLEEKLELEGVGISWDCANLLNNGLDVFLKRLIEPCVGISGSRRCKDSCFRASMLDFRVAMELNPCVLGEDWPTQLEKICHYAL